MSDDVARLLGEEEEDDERMVRLVGLDDCIVGFADVLGEAGITRRLIYGGPNIVHSLMRQGMTQDDAMEHLEFNIENAYMGRATPVIMWPAELVLNTH